MSKHQWRRASHIAGLFVAIALLGVNSELWAQASDLECVGCVGTRDIADRAIGSGKLNDNSVYGPIIKRGAVNRSKLAKGVQDSIDQSLGGILLNQVPVSDGSGVAAEECPVNSIIGSASCYCDSEDEARNYGVLFMCTVAGNGAVAGCFPEGTTLNPGLPAPLAVLTLVCVSGVQNDGAPIEPVFFKATLSDPSKIDSRGVEFDIAVNSTRSAVAAYTSRLYSASE